MEGQEGLRWSVTGVMSGAGVRWEGGKEDRDKADSVQPLSCQRQAQKE